MRVLGFHAGDTLLVERFACGKGFFRRKRVKEFLPLFLEDIQNRALLGKSCNLILRPPHASVQINCRGDIVLLKEFQPRLIGFGFHKLPPKMRCHARRILPLLNESKQIAVMVVQRKKSLVLWMRAIRLGLRAREERRSDTGFNLCEIARDGALDVFFRKCCVFAFRIHIPFLSA